MANTLKTGRKERLVDLSSVDPREGAPRCPAKSADGGHGAGWYSNRDSAWDSFDPHPPLRALARRRGSFGFLAGEGDVLVGSFRTSLAAASWRRESSSGRVRICSMTPSAGGTSSASRARAAALTWGAAPPCIWQTLPPMMARRRHWLPERFEVALHCWEIATKGSALLWGRVV